MSREYLEIVRKVYDAAERRDAEAVLALYHPDVVLDTSRLEIAWLGEAEGGVFRGHNGLRTLFREWGESWERLEYSYDELIDAGDHVISVVTRRARGRSSGVAVQRRFALVWTLRNGKIVRVEWFLTRAEALEAAGLSA